jgi:hypothetical protein
VKRSLAVLVSLINWVALCTYFAQLVGMAPAMATRVAGDAMQPFRFLQWSFTTPLLICALTSIAGDGPVARRLLARAVACDWLMLAFGFAERYGAAPARAATFAVSYCLQALHVEAEDEPQLLTPEALPPVLAVLTEAMLTDDAVVGNHAVDALSNLAEGYLGAADTQSSTPLSPYFQSLVQALLQAAAGSARPGAYGALEVVISAAAEADAATLGALLPHMLQLVCAATAAPAPTPEAAALAALAARGLPPEAQLFERRAIARAWGGAHVAALADAAEAAASGGKRGREEPAQAARAVGGSSASSAVRLVPWARPAAPAAADAQEYQSWG